MSETNEKFERVIEKIKQNPVDRDAYLELANHLAVSGRIDQAIKAFSKANSFSEDYITLYNIGCLHYRKKDFKQAVIVLERSKLLNSRSKMVYILAGLCYGRMKNYKASETNFINVIMNDPGNLTALTALSVLYYNQGRTEESLKMLNRLSASGKKNGTVSRIKSEILFNSGMRRESADEIKQVKEISDRYRVFNDYIRSVPVSILTDKYGSIDEKIRKLEENPQKTRDNLMSLSLCCLFSGNTDSAIDYLLEARGKIAV